MHISRLLGAGGACTCQKRACDVWFHPGNGTEGPRGKGQRQGLHRLVSPSQQEWHCFAQLLCQRLWGMPPPTAGRLQTLPVTQLQSQPGQAPARRHRERGRGWGVDVNPWQTQWRAAPSGKALC